MPPICQWRKVSWMSLMLAWTALFNSDMAEKRSCVSPFLTGCFGELGVVPHVSSAGCHEFLSRSLKKSLSKSPVSFHLIHLIHNLTCRFCYIDSLWLDNIIVLYLPFCAKVGLPHRTLQRRSAAVCDFRRRLPFTAPSPGGCPVGGRPGWNTQAGAVAI